jgi:hypothetical protein
MALRTTQRPAFGRRINPQAQPAAPVQPVRAAEPVVTPLVMPPAEPAAEALSVDKELRAWKDARGSRFIMPWRQIYLMASLCFGIASFVLPDSVNDSVDYLLWGLCGLSAFAWYNGRKKKSGVTAPAAP